MKNIFKKIVVAVITQEAKYILRKYKPHIVAVTGSVGKTSTKDAIYTALASSFFVRKSEKSFNSDIGIPLTILGCANAWSDPIEWIKNIFRGIVIILRKNRYPEWLVLEVGADRPGDIFKVTRWLKPDVTVLTRFGKVPVHVEYFKTKAELVAEKGWLVRELKKNGVLIYNIDDEDSVKLAAGVAQKKISYGLSGADITASHDEILYEDKRPIGVSFKASFDGNSLPISIMGGLGKQHIYPVLAALAVGISQSVNAVKVREAMLEHITPRARMRLIAGIGGSTIIDDTYNSSPVALHEALHVLKSIHTTGRKIAVLGDMMELGKYSAEEHREAGRVAAACADMLITVGIRSENIASGALSAGMKKEAILNFQNSTDAADHVSSHLLEGDIVLVKGSQSMRMERVCKKIMQNPEVASEVLVRQEKEWLEK